nr:hypothetical protein [Tanacetum cinerariifolium]
KHVSKGDTAIGDLMILVRDKLLRIGLPVDSNSYTPGRRTNTNDMTEEIAKILARADSDEKYAFGQANQFETNPPDTTKPEASV